MGGNILKLRSEELREEGYAEGQREGRIEGIAEGRAEGIAEGREEGKAEGLKEGKKIIALRMYRAGMGLQEISDMVDMPEQDIKEWLQG